MAILTAVYSNFSETQILVTYDDGRPEQNVPDNLANADRQEVAEWEALPNTITPFVSVAGKVALAQTLATEKLTDARNSTLTSHSETDGLNTFLMDRETASFVLASLDSTTPASITLIDTSDASQTVTTGGQQTLLDNLKASVQTDITGFITDITAINAAGTVAAVDAALAASVFGDLSPVFS